MTGWTDKIVFVRFSIKYKIKDRRQQRFPKAESQCCLRFMGYQSWGWMFVTSSIPATSSLTRLANLSIRIVACSPPP